MFWLKACPRCKGDLFLDASPYVKDIVCIQCGYRRQILMPDNKQAREDYRNTLHKPRHREKPKRRVPITL